MPCVVCGPHVKHRLESCPTKAAKLIRQLKAKHAVQKKDKQAEQRRNVRCERKSGKYKAKARLEYSGKGAKNPTRWSSEAAAFL